jgi:hypothetical protein
MLNFKFELYLMGLEGEDAPNGGVERWSRMKWLAWLGERIGVFGI